MIGKENQNAYFPPMPKSHSLSSLPQHLSLKLTHLTKSAYLLAPFSPAVSSHLLSLFRDVTYEKDISLPETVAGRRAFCAACGSLWMAGWNCIVECERSSDAAGKCGYSGKKRKRQAENKKGRTGNKGKKKEEDNSDDNYDKNDHYDDDDHHNDDDDDDNNGDCNKAEGITGAVNQKNRQRKKRKIDDQHILLQQRPVAEEITFSIPKPIPLPTKLPPIQSPDHTPSFSTTPSKLAEQKEKRTGRKKEEKYISYKCLLCLKITRYKVPNSSRPILPTTTFSLYPTAAAAAIADSQRADTKILHAKAPSANSAFSLTANGRSTNAQISPQTSQGKKRRKQPKRMTLQQQLLVNRQVSNIGSPDVRGLNLLDWMKLG